MVTQESASYRGDPLGGRVSRDLVYTFDHLHDECGDAGRVFGPRAAQTQGGR